MQKNDAKTTETSPTKGGRGLQKRVIAAVLFGLLLSGASYFVWCSMQWRNAAQETKSASATEGPEVGATGATNGTSTTVISPFTTTTGPDTSLAAFTTNGLVRMTAQIGDPILAANTKNRTHVSANLNAIATGTTTTGAATVVLVIDTSGSMDGERLQNAKGAAQHVIDNLRDGDRVSLISYASNAQVTAPMTIISPNTRQSLRSAISGIRANGGTCVSCGIEMARSQMGFGAAGGVSRMILLSDGQANAGLTDVDALSSLAHQAEASGISVSTIGVGLDYNEVLMTAMAVSGNGSHYFVPRAFGLESVLAKETASLREMVAGRVEVTFTLGQGVRFVRGFDRTFTPIGNSVVVQLGDLGPNAERTILFEVEADTTSAAKASIADVKLSYVDLATRQPTIENQTLVAAVSTDATLIAQTKNPAVLARVEQAALSEAIALANVEIRNGDVAKAQGIMREQAKRSRGRNLKFKNKKLDKQLDDFEEAAEDLDEPAAATAEGRSSAAKDNAVLQRDLLH